MKDAKSFDFSEAASLGYFDNAKRWYPRDLIARKYIRENGYRSPSRAWNMSYLRPIMTQKFFKYYNAEVARQAWITGQIDAIRERWHIPEGQFVLPIFSKHEIGMRMQMQLLEFAYHDEPKGRNYIRLAILLQLDNKKEVEEEQMMM